MRLVVDSEGFHVVLRVTTASEEDVGIAAIEEGCSEIVLCRTVPNDSRPPVAVIATGKGVGNPGRTLIPTEVIRLASSTFQIEQILISRAGEFHTTPTRVD